MRTMAEAGVFCGECGWLDQRGPFTVIRDQDGRDVWLCRPCTENVFDLIVGHNYASGECACNGDARQHGYLTANG